MIKWDIYKAKAWMLRVGMDHIKDGLFAEGGEIMYETKWGTGCDNETLFRQTLARICGWNNDDIEDAVKEVLQ